MGPNPQTFRRNVSLIAGAAILARLAISLVSWRQLRALDSGSRTMARGQEVVASLESVRSALAGAEASEAAYLITGDSADLSAFDQAQRAARRQLGHAWTLAADEAAIAPRLTDAARLVDQRFELAGVAAAARRKGLDAARARVALKVGRDATDKAFAAIDEARSAETALLDARAAAHQKALSRALTGIFAAAAGSLVAVLLVTLWLLPAFDERLAGRPLRPEPASLRGG